MQQKIIIKVQIACHKCRTKALRIVATASGVVSVTVQGEEALVVTGICVDPVVLTATLRKKVGVAILLSVEELKDSPAAGDKNKGGGEEKEKPKEKTPEKEKPAPTPPVPPCCSYGMPPPCQPSNYYYPQPQYCMYEIPRPDPNPPCSIM